MDRKLLFIRWHDACGAGSQWQFIDDLESEPLRDYIVHSVGYLLRENDSVIHIAPHFESKEGNYCGDMQIPKSAIIDMWEIVDA